jgi:hypothetical protein
MQFLCVTTLINYNNKHRAIARCRTFLCKKLCFGFCVCVSVLVFRFVFLILQFGFAFNVFYKKVLHLAIARCVTLRRFVSMLASGLHA